MTTPVERTRALLWGGAFLIEVSANKKLLLDVRRQAFVIARHFPTIEEVKSMASTLNHNPFAVHLALPNELPPDTEIGQFGPLTWNTRLGLPE